MILRSIFTELLTRLPGIEAAERIHQLDAEIAIVRHRQDDPFELDAMSPRPLGPRLITLAAGIIDPTKVVRLALENAVSVAGVLLLTDGVANAGRGIDLQKPAGAGLEHP